MNDITKEMKKYAQDLRDDGEGKSVVEANVTSLVESKWDRLMELSKGKGKEPGDIRDEIVKEVMESIL